MQKEDSGLYQVSLRSLARSIPGYEKFSDQQVDEFVGQIRTMFIEEQKKNKLDPRQVTDSELGEIFFEFASDKITEIILREKNLHSFRKEDQTAGERAGIKGKEGGGMYKNLN